MSNIKQSAQAIVAKEIIRGGLVREPCSKCGAQKTDAHHEDYNQPLWVTWLCRKCHRLRHAELDRQNSRRGQEDRTTLNLPADMTRLIDNYWHAEQLRSRNEAIRELLAYALDAKLKPTPQHIVTDDMVERIRKAQTSSQPAKEQRR